MRAMARHCALSWRGRERHHARVSTLLVDTSEGVVLRHEIAGAGSRLAAGLADGVFLTLGYLFVLLTALLVSSFDLSGISGFVAGLLIGGSALVAIAYHVLFHAFWSGQTPGKRWLGLAVMSADGYPASAFQILLRGLVWPIDVFFTLPAPIGLYAIAVTEKHQRLGDLVAGTLVVRLPKERVEFEPWPNETWSSLPVRVLPLSPGMGARLSAQDVALLRALLTRTELDPDERRRLFVETARAYSQRLELGGFDDARVVLREVYLFAREMLAARAA
jgi:uncharacterized RDD family membrane protein YckC